MSDTSTSMVTLAGTIASLVLAAGQFDNHLWRIICIFGGSKILPVVYGDQAWYVQWLISLAVNAAIWWIPHLRTAYKRSGCVVITGADSGMGQATVLYLAETNDNAANNGSYDKIFAAAFNAKQALEKLEEKIKDKSKMKYIQVIPLDATKDDSVKQAAATVSTFLKEKSSFLSGVVCYHGIGYNGPLPYMPMSLYQTQMDVNYFGNIRMTQAFLPLLQSTTNATTHFRRMIFTGTGGGPCTPCPSLLSAYMSSKFAGEAMAQCLKQELYMTQGDGPKIDVSVINPGFVKPTQLMADGIKLTEKMWKMCEDQEGSSIAKDTYGKMMEHFQLYAELQPGTHVSEVSKAAEQALTAHSPRSSYKVGIDSKLAPIVGMFPTGVREWIARNGIYGVLSPAKTVPGYRV
ncbi:beta-hydroxybutyrate dehydrogenase, mitochondrial [Seminavis robusta]|uniref:Beta-hydroxybutyrate dehydrogenase, mitochondrial n=1 Tax=Seminavis robusta TaxID=568900 RepID=A0A9N8E6J1_9STRA|nr:beta-hydroxybutyrate dehydrogenase, mitochondrial [Seminavis robusta]|eukprot:Sro550_g164690.1 beta-hydroxybutyrate dehydrogenase, mitochondrial (404) ;mRNA; f:28747-30059